jgi:hypothetical protein
MSPPSSRSDNKPRMISAAQAVFRAGVLVGLFFYLEDGANMLLRNVG